jgi:exocyst complex component 5
MLNCFVWIPYRATARLETTDHTKTEPSLQALSLLRSVDLISHLWQRYVNIALLPLAAGSVVVRREMVVFNNQAVSKVEGATNGLMQRLIDGEYSVTTCFVCVGLFLI